MQISLSNCPHDLDAERDVLGALLRQGTKTDEIVELLPDRSVFHDHKHRRIYDSILKLHAKCQDIDITTVASALGGEDLNKIGGRVYLVGLAERVASSAHVLSHARIVAKKAHLRKIAESSQIAIEQSQMPDADPQQIIGDLERMITSVSGLNGSEVHHIDDLSIALADKLLKGPNKADADRLLKTRLPELNERLGGGLHKGHLVVVGGLPSQGKTSLALDVVLCNGNLGKRSLFFSIDETEEDIVRRAFQQNLGFEGSRLTNLGPWTDAEQKMIRQTAMALQKHLWSVREASGKTVLDIRTAARAYKRKHGELDIIVIDYIGQIIPNPRSGNQSREREMAEITGILKETAKELECCVIAVSQLNRLVTSEYVPNIGEKRLRSVPRPRMSHLKDSGAIEADANVILLPFLPSELLAQRYGDRHEWTIEARGSTPDSIPAEIIVAKNKMGPRCTVECRFQQKRMRFY